MNTMPFPVCRIHRPREFRVCDSPPSPREVLAERSASRAQAMVPVKSTVTGFGPAANRPDLASRVYVDFERSILDSGKTSLFSFLNV